MGSFHGTLLSPLCLYLYLLALVELLLTVSFQQKRQLVCGREAREGLKSLKTWQQTVHRTDTPRRRRSLPQNVSGTSFSSDIFCAARRRKDVEIHSQCSWWVFSFSWRSTLSKLLLLRCSTCISKLKRWAGNDMGGYQRLARVNSQVTKVWANNFHVQTGLPLMWMEEEKRMEQ